ncbi:MAG: hypothetical protein K0R00_2852 [Herbinix sp.]|jgi:hypothetical protein|nr:hypothetical protein [Herbinix sp.]
MTDIIIVLVIVAIVGAAIAKIVSEKKKGAKCIGCPSSGKSSCGCNANKQ